MTNEEIERILTEAADQGATADQIREIHARISEPDTTADVAKSIQAGAIEGGINLGTFPVTAYRALKQGQEWVGNKAENAARRALGIPETTEEERAAQHEAIVGDSMLMRGQDKVSDLVDKNIYKPQTLPGKLAKTGTEYSVAFLPFAKGATVLQKGMNALSTGGTSGVTSEGMGQALKGTELEFPARLIGAISAPMALEKGISTYNTLSRAKNFKPMEALQAISDAYYVAMDRAHKFYELPKQLGEGRFIKAPQVKNYLDTIIDDVANTPVHEARSQIGTLQRIRENLSDEGFVPVDDLLELRKFTNKFFDPKRFTDKTATYGKFNAVIDNGLNQAKREIPNFGEALGFADRYWANNVKQPFLNNKVLNQHWTPSDAHNLRMVKEGFLREPADETARRAFGLVEKTRDTPTYNSVRRALPEKVGEQYDAALLENLPASRAQALGRMFTMGASGHFPSAIRYVGDVLNPLVSKSEKALKKAIKRQDSYTPLSQSEAAAEREFKSLRRNVLMEKGAPKRLESPPYRAGYSSPEEAAAVDAEFSEINPYTRLLTRPKETTFEDMRNAGRILPRKSPDFYSSKGTTATPEQIFSLPRKGEITQDQLTFLKAIGLVK